MFVPKQHRRIGELLLESDLIRQSDLASCLQLQKETGQPLGEILVKQGLITEEQLLRTLASQMNFSFVELKRVFVKDEVFQLIREDIAKKYEILPIDIQDNTLTVATADPLNMSHIDDLYFITNCDIHVVVATKKDIEWGINRYYLPQHQQSARRESEVKLDRDHEDVAFVSQLEEENSPANTLIQSMLHKAVARRASDIHIEQFETETLVRFRVDGILYDMMNIPAELKDSVISRFKILSNLRITEKRKPQDGGFHTVLSGLSIDVRASTMPTMFGEKLVLRLLQKENTYEINQLGFSSENLSMLRKAAAIPNGMILVTGPTGSGKTTTLYSILNELNTTEKNIVTIEDPVEYIFPRINQIQVNPRAGLTFASGLRSILRQDPDIIMVGEIRDEETASIAVQAALTGHLMLSTLHTNNAIGSVNRLLNMRVEPYLLASSLRGLVTQRLVRKICPDCRKQVMVERDVLQRVGIVCEEETSKVALYEGAGCFMCRGTGYRGRIAIQEVVLVDEELSHQIALGSTVQEIKKILVKKGHRSLFHDGVEKVQQGLTTLQELLRVAVDF